LKIIDKYIAFRFLATFAVISILAAAVIVVIESTEKVGDFIELDIPGKEIASFFAAQVPFMFSMLAPLFFFIAVIFFCSRMASKSEIIALTGGGMSFYRMLRPFLAVALLVASLFYVTNHYFLPKLNQQKLKFESEYTKKDQVRTQVMNIHYQTNINEMVYMRTYNIINKTGFRFQFERFDGKEVIEKIKGRSAEYNDSLKIWAISDYTQRWILDDGSERFEKGSKLNLELELDPEDLALVSTAREGMTTQELNEQIQRLTEKASDQVKYFKVEKHKRTATPISIFILTIIGVSIASRKARGGIGLHLAAGLAISALYAFAIQFSETLAENASTPAAIMVWIPNIVFGLAAIFLVFKAQK